MLNPVIVDLFQVCGTYLLADKVLEPNSLRGASHSFSGVTKGEMCRVGELVLASLGFSVTVLE